MKLLFEGEKALEFRLTKNPITNIRQSPAPLGYTLDSLDPNDAEYNVKKQKLLQHPNYSENELVVLKPGLNEFTNLEHAEYLYRELGNPVDGGSVPVGGNQTIMVQNNNILHEVDKDGKKIEGPFHKKYRTRSGVQVNRAYDPSAFKLPQ